MKLFLFKESDLDDGLGCFMGLFNCFLLYFYLGSLVGLMFLISRLFI